MAQAVGLRPKSLSRGVGSLPSQANSLEVRPVCLGPKSFLRGVSSLPSQAYGLVVKLWPEFKVISRGGRCQSPPPVGMCV
jgi:hypothetical protein